MDTWVFGLSLDEAIEWSITKVHKHGKDIILAGRAHRSYYGRIPLATKYDNDYVKKELHNYFSESGQFKKCVPTNVIEKVTSIGVSIVGLADRANLELISIAREDWGKPLTVPYIKFRELFNNVFPLIPVYNESIPPRINIHNETTAKCLAEWRVQPKNDPASSIFYVMFSKGVNAGFVSHGHALYTELHTELGHMWPRLHKLDMRFNAGHSGCRIHKYCFEGLASERRVRESWAGGEDVPLSELPDEAHDVIAFYIAQMCMNGVLAVSPARILLGGTMIFPKLIEYIEGYFEYFNDGGTGERYLNYGALQRKRFIRKAVIGPKEAGLAAALELALRVEENAAMALRVSRGPKPKIVRRIPE
jgi:predicted NBD/HSP70 family sugar kinase